ncbi:MAG: hypothetical protein P4L99_28165 [Chthoniobacter sp.]|nr:hypothetical protein [Chthoniobacter sp.]
MTQIEAAKAGEQLKHITASKRSGVDASNVRNQFVVSTVIKVGRFTDLDSKIAVWVKPKGQPLVTEVTAIAGFQAAQKYAAVKEAWQVFQDIGDSKFKRVGQPGVFPAVEDLAGKDGIVTDTWEAEGIRIELSVRHEERLASLDLSAGTFYWVELTATEIPSATTAAK